MKTASDDLHILIKALTPQEKRYFKVVTGLGEDSKEEGKAKDYHKLFDVIDKQEHYDEQAILEQYKGEKFIKNFAVAKKYLYDVLLKCLVDYNAANTAAHDVRYKMLASNLLRNRGIHDQADKQLAAAKKIAERNEGHIFLMQILQGEARTVGTVPDSELEERLRQLEEIQDHYLRLVELDTKYILLYFWSSVRFRQVGFIRTESDKAVIEEILRHPLLLDESTPQAPGHKITHFSILSRAHYLLGNAEEAYQHHKRCLQVWETTPAKIERGIGEYAGALINFCARCLAAHRYDEFEAAMQKFRALPKNNIRVRLIAYEGLASLELTYYYRTGQHEKSLARIPEIEQEGKVLSERVPKYQHINLYFNILNTYLVVGNFEKALEYANAILREDPLIPELYNYTELLTLIIHIELGNSDLVEYSVRSLYRHLKKTNRLFRFEEIFLKYSKKFVVVDDIKKVRLLMQQMKSELEDIANDPYQKRALELFDMISWLESKIRAVPFREVLMHKNAQTPP